MQDTHVQKAPALRAHEAAQLLFDQAARGQARARVGEAFALGTVDGVLDAQFEFFNVEGFGNVVVRAQFQAGDLVRAFVALGEKMMRMYVRVVVQVPCAPRSRPYRAA
jgi:hypothetical protein